MRYIFLRCKECEEESDIYIGDDGPSFCPECRSVDNFYPSDIDNEIEKEFLVEHV